MSALKSSLVAETGQVILRLTTVLHLGGFSQKPVVSNGGLWILPYSVSLSNKEATSENTAVSSVAFNTVLIVSSILKHIKVFYFRS